MFVFSDLAIDELVYQRFCPHIPMFLPHFGYHTLHVVPFLTESQCIRRWVRQEQPEASVTMFNTTGTEPDNLQEQDMDHENSVTIPTVDGFFVPVCVMEKPMKNPYHCYLNMRTGREMKARLVLL